MYHYEIPLLEKKPGNIILHLCTNNAPYKSDTDILKDLIELKHFILENLPSYKKITLSSTAVHTDKESATKNNENLTNTLKEQNIPSVAHNSITHKHLYPDCLQLNSISNYKCETIRADVNQCVFQQVQIYTFKINSFLF